MRKFSATILTPLNASLVLASRIIPLIVFVWEYSERENMPKIRIKILFKNGSLNYRRSYEKMTVHQCLKFYKKKPKNHFSAFFSLYILTNFLK